jgi:hypothetical protein
MRSANRVECTPAELTEEVSYEDELVELSDAVWSRRVSPPRAPSGSSGVHRRPQDPEADMTTAADGEWARDGAIERHAYVKLGRFAASCRGQRAVSRAPIGNAATSRSASSCAVTRSSAARHASST